MIADAKREGLVLLTCKKPPTWAAHISNLVEMRRIELLSEDNTTWISPSAVCVFV